MSGGANRSMLQLILELRKNHNINPVVIVPYGKKPTCDHGLDVECINNNIPVVRSIIPWFIHGKVWIHRFKYVLLLLLYPFLLLKLKKYNIQLVHSNGSVFDLGARISKSLSVPHIWHFREFGTEDISFKPIWGIKYIKKQYAKADQIIAISRAIKESYKDKVDESKMVVIYNGIDLNKYKSLSIHNNNKIQFVVVGVVTPHKNQFEAIKAISVLIRKGITSFHLNIIGLENAKYKNLLSNFVKENKLENYVTFWGVRNNVPSLLSSMDVGLMLSRTEAFGRVTIEYMFQKLAVIASDTGANPELIKDGQTGFLYHFGDYQDLADKMEKLIKNNQLLQKISTQGCDYARAEFTSLKNSDKIFQLYKLTMKNFYDLRSSN